MNKAQQQTGAAVRQAIIDALERAGDDDAAVETIHTMCTSIKDVDTGACDDELLVNDPAVQAAFKDMVSRVIGTFQQIGDE